MWRIAISVLILLLDVTAIIGNAVVIIAFITNKKLRKPSGCYVTNLAAADLCMSLFGIPFYVATVVLNYWPYGEYFCAIWTGMERVCSLVSNFAIVAICFDRFWLVTNSSHYLGTHTIKDAKWRIAVIWTVAFFMRVPFVVFGMIKTWKELAPSSVCDPSSIYDIPFQVGIYEYDTIYTLIATLGEFLIPLILIVVWGVQVYIYLENREKKRLLKAVERSRAMSLDFTFSQRQIAHYREIQQRRGSNQSFLSRLFNTDQKNQGNNNGKSHSQDTIAGPLSEQEEEAIGEKLFRKRKSSCNESTQDLRKDSQVKGQCLTTSRVSIVLDPVSSQEAVPLTSPSALGDCKDETDLDNNKLSDIVPITRISIDRLSCKSNRTSQQSLTQRRSASLNTLNLQTFPDKLDVNKDFPTSRSTPSIILSCMCDHNVLLTPDLNQKDFINSTPQMRSECFNCFTQSECTECNKANGIQSLKSSGKKQKSDNEAKRKSSRRSLTSLNSLQNGNKERRSSLSVLGSPVRKRVIREGSSGATCDFLDVPSRSHHRLTLNDLEVSEVTATENGSVQLDNKDNENGTRNSSFSSCASDLPESVSSIMTFSEPPSPGGKRASTTDNSSAEFVQKVLNSKARQRYRSYRRRALMTIIVMICVFVVFQLPYVIITCIYSFCTTDCLPDNVYESANWWYWSKVFLNPFLYAHISPEFRRYSSAVLRCKSPKKRNSNRRS